MSVFLQEKKVGYTQKMFLIIPQSSPPYIFCKFNLISLGIDSSQREIIENGLLMPNASKKQQGEKV